ncbi:MAG: hypothetical protein KDD64_14545 [Bdellovibrionales bacterium]|nr:hypothetical protein [Bdellovibrionales bacterium]
MRLLILFTTFFVVSLLPQGATDALADQLAVLSVNDDQSLSWKLLAPQSGEQTEVSSSFGAIGDHILFGRFTSTSGTPQLGTLHDLGSSGVRWRVIDENGDLLDEMVLGGNEDFFVAGGDFDKSGLVDPVVITTDGRKLVWEMSPDAFGSSPGQEKSVSFGKKSQLSRAFYANPFGDGDWAGVVKKNRKKKRTTLKFKNLESGVSRRISLKRSVRLSERPLPVASSGGSDLVVLVRSVNGSTKIVCADASGRIVARHTFPSSGTVVVGEFDSSSAGEEIAVQSDDVLLVFNPFAKSTREYDIPDGILVDSVNLNTFVEEEQGGGGGNNQGSSEQCTGGDPGICGCYFLDETDGYKTGFLYKRKSDTYGGIVTVLPNPCGRLTNSVVTLDTDCNEIHTLTDTGFANPDSTGNRHHFKETNGTYTGQWYKSNYGSIILKLKGTSRCFMIQNPAQERVD